MYPKTDDSLLFCPHCGWPGPDYLPSVFTPQAFAHAWDYGITYKPCGHCQWQPEYIQEFEPRLYRLVTPTPPEIVQSSHSFRVPVPERSRRDRPNACERVTLGPVTRHLSTTEYADTDTFHKIVGLCIEKCLGDEARLVWEVSGRPESLQSISDNPYDVRRVAMAIYCVEATRYEVCMASLDRWFVTPWEYVMSDGWNPE